MHNTLEFEADVSQQKITTPGDTLVRKEKDVAKSFS